MRHSIENKFTSIRKEDVLKVLYNLPLQDVVDEVVENRTGEEIKGVEIILKVDSLDDVEVVEKTHGTCISVILRSSMTEMKIGKGKERIGIHKGKGNHRGNLLDKKWGKKTVVSKWNSHNFLMFCKTEHRKRYGYDSAEVSRDGSTARGKSLSVMATMRRKFKEMGYSKEFMRDYIIWAYREKSKKMNSVLGIYLLCSDSFINDGIYQLNKRKRQDRKESGTEPTKDAPI